MKSPWREPKLLVLLATGSLIVLTGAALAPVLPEIVEQLEFDQALAGYIISTHFLTVAISSPVVGLLADRVGQVRILLISLLFYACCGIAGGLMSSFIPLLVTRGLIGVASGGITASSLGLLVKMYPSDEERSQAIAYATSAITFSNILYPILAGWLGSYNWRFAFGLYALGFPLALCVFFILKQPAAPQKPATEDTNNAQQIIQILKNPLTVQFLLTLSLVAATAYAVVIYLPMYLKEVLGAGTVLNGIFLGSEALGAAIISALAMTRIAKVIGLVGTSVLGLGGMAVSLVAIPQFQTLWILLAITIFLGFGLGLVMPSLYNLLSKVTPLDLQSSILAVGTGANFLGQFFSPTLFGFVISQSNLDTVFYVAAVVPLLIGLSLMVTAKIQNFTD